MRKLPAILACILLLASSYLQAADNDTTALNDTSPLLLQNDTVQSEEMPGVVVLSDTLVESDAIVLKQGWKPDPMRSVWLGAVVPGLGQIYNRKYWKLPIVYGGFLGCAYAISWNNGMYTDYKNAYRDIIDSDDTTNSFLDVLPEGYTIESLGGTSAYQSILQTRMNTYRRYRDLSIIVTIGLYALTLIDAYVDAQLYDFDISPDLSLNIQPVIYKDEYNKRGAELMFSFRF